MVGEEERRVADLLEVGDGGEVWAGLHQAVQHTLRLPAVRRALKGARPAEHHIHRLRGQELPDSLRGPEREDVDILPIASEVLNGRT